MDNNDIAASIAQLKEAVDNIKKFTDQAQITLESIRKDVTDRSHAVRNEFNAKFSVLENKFDIMNNDVVDLRMKASDRTCINHADELKEMRGKVNFLERVIWMGLGGVTLVEFVLKVLK